MRRRLLSPFSRLGRWLAGLRRWPAGLWRWLAGHARLVAVALTLAAAAAIAIVALTGEDEEPTAPGPAPAAVSRAPDEPEPREIETPELGFPGFATKNTTRVAGSDPAADAAAVALAVHPSTGGVPGPDAVSIVDSGDWRSGLAASSLVAAPVGAPILVSADRELGDLGEEAIRALDPAGSGDSGGDQVFSFGQAAVPDDLDVARVEGSNAAEIAAEAARLREQLAGRPEHLLIASSDEPGFAMPAAGWAARSGDPILFAQRNSLPEATREALARQPRVPAYVLGPEDVISKEVLAEVEKLSPSVERIGGDDPTTNSIAFARYADETFGWNINDPGHGFVVANASRPLDAAAAAPLSASGSWGPLLVTEEADELPSALRGFLLDLKPGYIDDPTRAVYNHVWLIGDESAVSVDVAAQIDELAEVAPVSSGVRSTEVEAPPAPKPEREPKR